MSDNIQQALLKSLQNIDTDFSSKELDDLCKQEGLDVQHTPNIVRIESSKSVEEPLSLNSRIINLGRHQTVTLLACKVIYTAYKENDLTTLIRVGILPNYENLLESALEVMELLRLFVASLKHPADQQYVATPGMTMKDYKKLVSNHCGNEERCETLLKSLKLNENYALYVLHYNLLSGSTIIQEPDRFVSSAKEASQILIRHLNTTSKDVDVKVILTRYQTIKSTYEEIIKLKKDMIADKINTAFNKSSRLSNALNKLEESYLEKSEKLSNAETILSKLDETTQVEMLSHIHKLYEQQLVDSQRVASGSETLFVDKCLQTLSLYEKNYKATRENLVRLKDILNKLVSSESATSDSAILEEIVGKVKTLLISQKNQQETIANLKHLASELVDITIDDEDDN